MWMKIKKHLAAVITACSVSGNMNIFHKNDLFQKVLAGSLLQSSKAIPSIGKPQKEEPAKDKQPNKSLLNPL